MSIKVMTLIWANAPYENPSIMLVLLALGDWANDDGLAWPSVPHLAAKARISERSARYILRRLERDGMISCQEHRGRNHTNHYQLNLQGLQVLMPTKPLENLQTNAQNLQTDALKPAIAVAPEPLEPLNIHSNIPVLSLHFVEEMLDKYGDKWSEADLRERIEEALCHKAATKWKDPERYVRNWLRRDAEHKAPPQHNSSKDHYNSRY